MLDVDDAVFLTYPEKFEQTVRCCDLVIVGNSFLDEHVRPFNEKTLLIPTCVEMARYPARDWSTTSTRPGRWLDGNDVEPAILFRHR